MTFHITLRLFFFVRRNTRAIQLNKILLMLLKLTIVNEIIVYLLQINYFNVDFNAKFNKMFFINFTTQNCF